MKPILMALCAAALTLSAAPAALAQGYGRDQIQCRPNDRTCPPEQMGKKQPAPQKKAGKAPAHKAVPHKGPQVGDSGHRGKPFHRASNSRFKAPPRGQEYRVLDDRLVLVDKDTLKVVAVLGLLSALIN